MPSRRADFALQETCVPVVLRVRGMDIRTTSSLNTGPVAASSQTSVKTLQSFLHRSSASSLMLDSGKALRACCDPGCSNAQL